MKKSLTHSKLFKIVPMIAVFFTFSALQAQNCATLLLEQQPVNTVDKTITVKVSLTDYLGQIPTIPTNVDNITFSLEVFGAKPFGAVPMQLSIAPLNNISVSGSLNLQGSIITYSMNPSSGTLSGNSTHLFDIYLQQYIM